MGVCMFVCVGLCVMCIWVNICTYTRREYNGRFVGPVILCIPELSSCRSYVGRNLILVGSWRYRTGGSVGFYAESTLATLSEIQMDCGLCFVKK